MENSIVPGVSHLLIHWLLATLWLMYTCTVLCFVEEACPAGLHHSGFSCGNHQPKLVFEIPNVKCHWWRQQEAAETFGISKKIFGWWFPQENPECTVLCVYTHDSPWVTKRCLKQTIFMWSFMLDIVDHSRVILKVPDETGCDYINASYINVSRTQCIVAYILSSPGIFFLSIPTIHVWLPE